MGAEAAGSVVLSSWYLGLIKGGPHQCWDGLLKYSLPCGSGSLGAISNFSAGMAENAWMFLGVLELDYSCCS